MFDLHLESWNNKCPSFIIRYVHQFMRIGEQKMLDSFENSWIETN